MANWDSPQVLNPEESQDEDDNVVVTDDSEEQLLGDAEVLVSKGQVAGGHAWATGRCDTRPTHRTRAQTARTASATKARRARRTATRRTATRRTATGTWTRASGSS